MRRCLLFVSVLFFGNAALDADSLLPIVHYQETPFSLGSPPSVFLEQSFGISNSGVVVGNFYADSFAGIPPPIAEGSFTYDTKTGVATQFEFPTPGNYNFRAVGINNSGEIIGSNYEDRSRTYQGFVGRPGAFQPLTVPGSISTQPLGINDAGVIVGAYINTSGAYFGFIYKPNGDFQTIDGPGRGTELSGINNLGQIVGGSGTIQPFLLSNNVYTYVGCGPPYIGQAVGINDSGTIAGSNGVIRDGRDGSCAFVERQITGINNSGTFVAGDGSIYTPTPEPRSVLLLLASGLAAIFFGKVTRRVQ